jgi:hypothetical protein
MKALHLLSEGVALDSAGFRRFSSVFRRGESRISQVELLPRAYDSRSIIPSITWLRR